MPEFRLKSDYQPAGGQPEAIRQLVQGARLGMEEQTMLGVTGAGKTFVMANVIQQLHCTALSGKGLLQDAEGWRLFILFIIFLDGFVNSLEVSVGELLQLDMLYHQCQNIVIVQTCVVEVHQELIC